MASSFEMRAKPEDIPWEFQADFGESQRLEELAKLLMAQNQKTGSGQMVGTHFVKSSPMQHLADQVAKMYGAYQLSQSRDARQGTLQKMAAAEDIDRRGIAAAIRGLNPSEMDPEGAPPDYARAAQLAEASKFEGLRKSADTYRQINANMLSAMGPRATPESLNTAMQAGGNAALLRAQPPEQYGPPSDIPGVMTPEGKPVKGQQNLRSQKWSELGTDRAPKQSVTVLGNSDEKPYITKVQEGMAAADVAAYNSALQADESNQALGRIKGFLAEGANVTGGPLAKVEVFVRNLAAEFKIPFNRAVDKINAMLSAEFTSRIAMQVLAGGRGISNDDRIALEAAFPSFSSGIPAEQLPAFIAQLEAINNAKVSSWMRRWKSLKPADQALYPNTFGSHRTLPPGGVSPYSDPEKERRYQEYKAQQPGGGQ